jgi:hypothetical protein
MYSLFIIHILHPWHYDIETGSNTQWLHFNHTQHKATVVESKNKRQMWIMSLLCTSLQSSHLNVWVGRREKWAKVSLKYLWWEEQEQLRFILWSMKQFSFSSAAELSFCEKFFDNVFLEIQSKTCFQFHAHFIQSYLIRKTRALWKLSHLLSLNYMFVTGVSEIFWNF